jgi:hypothetical protein
MALKGVVFVHLKMSANSGRSRMTSSGSGWDLAGLVSEV